MENRSSSGISLGVRFIAAGDRLKSPRTRDAFDPLAGVRSQLDEKLVQAMIDAEPKLLAWLRASHDHLVQFTTDPMTALRAALPEFDPALLARIAAIRSTTQRVAVDLPGVTIDRFTAEVAPK
jgi:hypothetical protein